MTQRERERPQDPRADRRVGDGPDPAAAADALAASREFTAGLLETGSAVMARSMSTSPEEYVDENEQEGGQ